MEGFEYGNARLRAMRSHLLAQNEIFQMAEANSLAELIGLLAKTNYQKSLEIELVQSGELDSIFAALRRDLLQTTQKIRGFYQEKEGRLVSLVLSHYDLHNIKSILRGLSRRSSSIDIQNTLLPVGEVSEFILTELLRAATPREALDILATLGLPIAQPLLALRAEHPGAELFEMELALDRWRFKEISRFVKEEPDGTNSILASLHLEADLANLLTILRFLHMPTEQRLIKEYLDKNGFAALFAGSGSIPIERLFRVYSTKNLKSAVAMLLDTPYAEALTTGTNAYNQSGRLSDIEKSLRRYQFAWQSRLIAKDPLGIGVVQGFLALKTNEIANLRRIARGIQLKIGTETLRAELDWML